MLKRLLRLFESSPNDNAYRIITDDQHGIQNKQISQNAILVIKQLQEHGFSAYLVGGGVRDLLLQGRPKDFDVATDATPEEIKNTFKRSRIIGKRFRIVHVRFGREIIEVTTFRASHESAQENGEAAQSDKGILLRDNVYGDIQSDAIRRDFTVNALYYNPINAELLDFTGSLEDLEARTLRMIGVPEKRYKEDPVRMLRAVRFAAKLKFTIELKSDQPIREHADYLKEIPAARLFEEVLKLFMSGYALETLNLLRDYGLFEFLFPGTDHCLDNGDPIDNEVVMQALINTDKRIRQNKRVTPAFLYAAFLWLPLRTCMRELVDERKLSQYDAMQQAAQAVIGPQLGVTAIPKRFLIPMREIWALQLRLLRVDARRADNIMEHPRFRAAYDFLLLREQAGENLNGMGSWWTKYQHADKDERTALCKQIKPKDSRRRRRPRNKAKNKSDAP